MEEFLKQLEELADASYENSGEIVKMVEKIVPTFHPEGEHPDGQDFAVHGGTCLSVNRYSGN